MIASENIIWVSDPETSWCLIRVQETPRLSSPDRQIFLKIIFSFSCIFYKEIVAFDVECYIFSNSQVVDTVNSASSVKRLLDSITFDVRVMYNAYQMEMNRISSKLEGLPNIEEVNIFNSSSESLHTIRMNHYLSTILFLCRSLWITSVQNVSCQ